MIRNQKLCAVFQVTEYPYPGLLLKKMFKIFRNGTVHAYHTGYLAANDDFSMYVLLSPN